MKKILIAVMAIALVAGLTGGAFAYFSDTETSTAEQATAGTVELKVDAGEWSSGELTLGPMAPGTEETAADFVVLNDGTLLGDLYMKISSVVDSQGAASKEAELTADPGDTVCDISTLLALTCKVDTVAVGAFDGTLLSAVPVGWTEIAPDLAASGSVDLTLGATLSGIGATNAYQGDLSTFTIELYLAQDGQVPS